MRGGRLPRQGRRGLGDRRGLVFGAAGEAGRFVVGVAFIFDGPAIEPRRRGKAGRGVGAIAADGDRFFVFDSARAGLVARAIGAEEELPAGRKPPERVALSVIVWPTSAEVASPARVGEALATVEAWFSAPQARPAGSLLASPSYSTVQRNSPACWGMKSAEVALPLWSGAEDVSKGVEQLVSAGP